MATVLDSTFTWNAKSLIHFSDLNFFVATAENTYSKEVQNLSPLPEKETSFLLEPNIISALSLQALSTHLHFLTTPAHLTPPNLGAWELKGTTQTMCPPVLHLVLH